MKILIVNGYKPGSIGDKKFNRLVKIIKQLFAKHKPRSASKFEYIVRDRNNIDDFLYEAYSKYSSSEAR